MRKLVQFILFISTVLRSSCETNRAFQLLKLVTTVSKQLDTKCMELLLYDNMSLDQYENYHTFFKEMAATHTSKTYNLEAYMDMKAIEERVPLMMCNRPLRMTMGTNKTRIPYEKMSHWKGSSLMKPVSLLIMRMPIEEFFRNASLPIDLITIAAVRKSDDSIELNAVYRVDTDSPLEVRKIGFWTSEYGLNLEMTTVHYMHRHFNGKVFRGLSTEFWPYATFGGFTDKNMKWDGIYPRVWRELESVLGFKSIIYRREEYGLRTTSGTWTGMVLEILKNEADVIVADVMLTHERVHVLDFVNVLSQTRSRIYHQEIGSQFSWDSAFLPFGKDAWLFIIINSICVALCLSLLNKLSEIYGFRNCQEPISYSYYMFFSLQTFVQQGSPTPENTYSGRIIYFFTYLTCSIGFAGYGAFLISFLSRDVPQRPFNSFDDLLKDGSYTVLIDYNNLAKVFSKSSLQGNINQLELAMQPFTETHHTNYTSTGLYLICKDKNLALVEKELIMNSMNPGALGCRVIEVNEYLKKVQEGIAFRRGSPYVTFIRFYAHRMREAGLIQRIVQNVRTPKAEVERKVKPIGFHHVSFAFIYYFFGLVFIFFLMPIEIWISSITAKKNDQQRRIYINQV